MQQSPPPQFIHEITYHDLIDKAVPRPAKITGACGAGGYLGRMQLVTGATGIAGSHILLECAQRGPVRAIHRHGSDRSIVERIFRYYRADADALLNAVEWMQTDILDRVGLDIAMRGVRYVHHAAAMVSFNPGDAGALASANIDGTANVVNAALEHGVERLCHVSSTATIGGTGWNGPRDESMQWEDEEHHSAYAISKHAAELEVHRGIAEGLDAVMVNPCIIIGPGPAGRSSMTLIERLRKGTRFYPTGSNAVVDARDVARCMLALMDQGSTGERYLLVGENVSYQRLFGSLATAFGRPMPDTALRPWMLQAAWRFERVRSLLTGSKPFITRDTAHSAIADRSFSAEKVQKLLGIRFIPAEHAVANVAGFLQGGRAY